MVLAGLLPAAAASTAAGLLLACSSFAHAGSAPAPGSSWQTVSPAAVTIRDLLSMDSLNRNETLASPSAATSVKELIQVDPATRTVVVRLGKPEPDPQPPTFGPKEASAIVTQAVVER